MKINRKDVTSMKIEWFAKYHGLTIEVRERKEPIDDSHRYYALFDSSCECIDSGVMFTEFGNGRTPEEAIDAYADKIQLKRIVINANKRDRREIDVPMFVK